MLDVLSVVSFLSRTKCPTNKQVVGLSPHKLSHFYRPQRSWAKVIFSQACVENSVHRGGGCLPQCMLGYTPREQTHPPGADLPGSRHPPEQTPPLWEQTPPEQTPPPGPDCSIRSTSGRYASYWNAFLFFILPFLMYVVISDINNVRRVINCYQ